MCRCAATIPLMQNCDNSFLNDNAWTELRNAMQFRRRNTFRAWLLPYSIVVSDCDWSCQALVQDRCDTLSCCQFIAIDGSSYSQFWLQINVFWIEQGHDCLVPSETCSRLYHKDIKHATLMRSFLFIFLAVVNGSNFNLYDCEEKLTCYEVLGVERTAELKQIRKNFRRRALRVRVQY